jgi:hypothetical protein
MFVALALRACMHDKSALRQSKFVSELLSLKTKWHDQRLSTVDVVSSEREPVRPTRATYASCHASRVCGATERAYSQSKPIPRAEAGGW